MKTADIEIEDMAVAGNVVLKRTSRAIVEYGTEMEASEHSGRKLSNNTKPDEGILPKGESKASTSGVTASAAIAMEVSAKPYSRRGSVSGPPTSTELADTNGVPRGADSKVAVDGIKLADKAQDSPNFAKTGLKPHKLDGLHQDDRPLNFGQVLPGIYRSSFPRTEDYPFYKKLGLKTVVTLVQKDFPAEYKPFLDENGIQHRVFDMEGTKKQAIPIQTMGAILRIVLNPRNYPLLLHCNHGRHRTGCVVAVIRKFHGWSLSSVLDEYRTYAEPKIRDCDVEYITAFNTMHLANLWPKETTFQFRFQRFYRATAFVFVILVIWLYSGSEMSLAASTPRPQPTA